MERAEHSILILGWDIASRVWLRRDGARHSQPDELGLILHEVLSRRKKLRVHILSWDFAMIYLLEREFLPIFKLPWRAHRRLHFFLDGNHPSGGSHHQKVVVVDDSVAFSGGFDLTNHRWDTPEHKTDEPRRVNPGGIHYEPFHDVQVAVSGEAAAALGDLARERWRRATGTSLSPPHSRSDSWPRHLSPDLEDVRVAIARTEPEWNHYPGIREVENLFLDMIGAARRSIYIENQYFTSARICQALIERLLTPEGPEIIMVVARENSGWLEKNSMGIIRSQLLQKLKQADQFGRLFVYNPSLPGGERMEVHSKIMVVDDAVARVGSANLSNRSMRLDTECDIMIESAGEERVSRGVAGFRDRLLGEHLGISPERVRDATRREGSPARAVEALRGGNRTLVPMEVSMEPLAESICLDAEFCDPEHPVSPEMIVSHMLPEEFKRPAIRRLPWVIAFGVALSCMAAIWRWALGDWARPEDLLKHAHLFWKMPLTPLMVGGAYLLAAFFLIPLTIMVLLTGFLLGPLYGFLYGWAGSLMTALILFGIGHSLGRERVRRLAGRRVNRVSYRLARHGFLAVAVLHILPVAPFTIINLVAGASRVSLRHYLIGTAIGMMPFVLVVAVFGDRLMAAVRDPGWFTLSVLGGLSVLLYIGYLWLKRIGEFRSGAGEGVQGGEIIG
jgi:phosphatidylserine/phosphatidylglycerophosphate/cardiolipin synthase-like enzyme/uncharacterized membrane protein YdjX (TVP38/TMEM64 family)